MYQCEVRRFPVPAKAFIELPRGGRLDVRVISIQATGLWVEAAEPIRLAFRANLRVIFPFESGSIGVNAEVVSTGGDCGFGVLIAPETDQRTRVIFEAWSKGQDATLELGRRGPFERPSIDPQAGGEAAFATEDIITTRRPRPVISTRLPLAGTTVLVIDDDDLVARALQAGLARRGGSVHLAGNGPAALTQLHEHRFDAVLLDWMLPSMSGGRVLEQMKREMPELPVAVVSGIVGSNSMRAAVRKLGADEVFAKPFELARISDWIAARVR